MLVNRLNQDELMYELRIRGMATGTVDQMRHALTMAIRMEKSGDSVRYPPYPFTEQEDLAAVKDKLADLQPKISSLSEPSSGNTFTKLQTKLSHVLGRIDHIPVTSTERPTVLTEALTLMDLLHQKAEDFEKNQGIPPHLSILSSPTAAANFAQSIQPSRRSSSISPNVAPSGSVGVKPVPPSKWNLKFSGEKKSTSLSAFLESVEELRVARHVTKEALLESGIDLFCGRAYQFYLAYRNQVSSWDEFVELLREEYLSPNYNEKLFEEICKRTQGPDESIGIYIAVMTGYFNRLTCPVSEETKLKILMRNIAPFYQHQLALVDVTSISHLRELGKRLEARKEAVENYSLPSRKSAVLEPDLAYVTVETSKVAVDGASTSSGGVADSRSSTREVICFRCNKPGHRAIGCTIARSKFCFRCKKEGVTVRTCPDCSQRSQGNGNRHS